MREEDISKMSEEELREYEKCLLDELARVRHMQETIFKARMMGLGDKARPP